MGQCHSRTSKSLLTTGPSSLPGSVVSNDKNPPHEESQLNSNRRDENDNTNGNKMQNKRRGKKEKSNVRSSATVTVKSSDAKSLLNMSYGSAPLQPSDVVMIMQGWNKVLAFKTAFSEALLIKWRFLVEHHAILQSSDDVDDTTSTVWRAMNNVERNHDNLALCFKARMYDAEELIMGFLDGLLRSFCPKKQTVARESYHPTRNHVILQRKEGDMSLECETIDDYTRLFARCGVEPHCWVLFAEAFLWAMRTHVPYAQDDDMEDLNKDLMEGAYAKAARMVALEGIEGYTKLRIQLDQDIFQIGVTRYWDRLDQSLKSGGFGEIFYQSLLEKFPELLDYFAKTDMDSLSLHFVATLDLLVDSIQKIGTMGSFRKALDHLGEVHRKNKIPTMSYAMVGAHLLDCLQGTFEAEEKATKDEDFPVTAKQLTQAFAVLYTEVMSITYYPMLREEKKLTLAQEFYESIQVELGWSDQHLSRRMAQVESELSATGTYWQTSEEIELGARLAWRNSAKCIGRISWNTLQVRDCRHVTSAAGMFQELEEHLKIATAGTNIQSVMTVFEPQSPDKTLGTRFWSSQTVRYAAYHTETGEIMGDPANLELTDFLLEHNLWVPPKPRTPFDVLPLVLKELGRKKPHVHHLSKEVLHEVPIEHPTRPEVSALGYRWTTVPAISNFKMNLGGIIYQNMPFNGWFMSTEIVRNLMERYDAGPAMAKALGLDKNTDCFWQETVKIEIERAVLHSFKKNGYTIVDPPSVGKSFCTHVRREREDFGRECPGQWSWIGGLVGPTNPTWHLEMRDFLVRPQYEYCAEGLALYESMHEQSTTAGLFGDDQTVTTVDTAESLTFSTPHARILIAYGSETGNAEAAARRLKGHLQLLKPTVKNLNEVSQDFEKLQKRKFSHLFLICSTFGKGNPPSNAKDFFQMQLGDTDFSGTKFAVLALGSSLYPDFCKAGIDLDKKLFTSRSERFIPLKRVDDAAGGDGDISEWIELVHRLVLPAHLEEEMMFAKQISLDCEPPTHVFEWTGEGTADVSDAEESKGSLCLSNTELIDNSDQHGRSIRKITFKLPPGVKYETGDHLCVYPNNSADMVQRLLKCFEFELAEDAFHNGYMQDNPDSEVDALQWQQLQKFDLLRIEDGEKDPADVVFRTPTCLRDVLTHDIDLSLSSKNVSDLFNTLKPSLDMFMEKLDPDKGEVDVFSNKELVKKFDGFAALILKGENAEKTIATDELIAEFPTIVHFFEHFRGLFIDAFAAKDFGWDSTEPMVKLAEVLVTCPRLQPRYYSISSSSNTGKQEEVSITVGVLTTSTSKGVEIKGVCSHYLATLQAGIGRAKISVSRSSFRLPVNPSAPIMMVGTGTGLSPLMGFLEDKFLQWQESDNLGKIHLFFGCRTENDFIYKDIITKYKDSGMIECHLALSRSKVAPKKYVQNCIAEMGKKACDLLLDKDTHYYVCGDARMADCSFEACVEILRKHAIMSRVAAVQHLRQMQLGGRWQTDVWGIVSHFEDSKKQINKNKRMKATIWLAQLTSNIAFEEQ